MQFGGTRQQVGEGRAEFAADRRGCPGGPPGGLATASSGTAAPAASRPRASTPQGSARISRQTVTAPAPTRIAASGGPMPRMNRSWVASTSLISAASRSPDRKAASPAGASRWSGR